MGGWTSCHLGLMYKVTHTYAVQVRLWDPRAGGKVAKLRGHTDNVRALALSHDGTRALSGASDGTVKLWDVGMQRCVQV